MIPEITQQRIFTNEKTWLIEPMMHKKFAKDEYLRYFNEEHKNI